MKKKKMDSKLYVWSLISIVVVAIMLCVYPSAIFAETGRTNVTGQIYEFDKDSHYEISESSKTKEAKTSDKVDTYVSFTIFGEIENISEKNGVPAYKMKSSDLDIFYTYGDTLLKAEEKDWHLIDETSKKVDNMKLDDKIKKGVIIVQTSNDRKNWTNVKHETNIFDKEPVMTKAFYEASDVEIINGCYYRVIVVYETSRLIKTDKLLFIP